MYVRNDPADHQPDDERQASNGLKGLSGDWENLVEFRGESDNCQVFIVRPKLLDITPGPDEQEHVANLEPFVDETSVVHDTASPDADDRKSEATPEMRFEHRASNQIRRWRHDDFRQSDFLRTIAEIGPLQRQLFKEEI